MSHIVSHTSHSTEWIPFLMCLVINKSIVMTNANATNCLIVSVGFMLVAKLLLLFVIINKYKWIIQCMPETWDS